MEHTNNPVVGIVMGSDSDWPIVSKATEILRNFGIAFEVRVISAHRTPELASRYATEAESRGLRVILAAAGGALNGLDALLATVQMPAGIPVGTLTLGSAGPVNAAILAVQILATSDDALRQRLHDYKKELQRKVEAGNAKVAAALQQETGA